MPTNEKRFVLDTSTLISAALNKRGKPRKAVVYAARHGLLLASYETFDELETRLQRPKFAPYLHEEDRDVFINWMYGLTSLIPITETVRVCRDPEDDKFLNVAVSGHADAIISSDRDLQVLHPFRGIPILSPAQFLEWVQPSS